MRFNAGKHDLWSLLSYKKGHWKGLNLSINAASMIYWFSPTQSIYFQ